MNATAQQLSSQMTPELDQAAFQRLFDQRFDERMAQIEADHIPSMSIISTKGTLDMAYPPFILAATAAALGWDVSVFFTFYGLTLLKKDLDLEISPLGNPAMPMKMPVGPEWLQKMDIKIPNLVMAGIPGFEKMATGMMKKSLSNKGVASIDELRSLCLEADVKLIGCQMTIDLFNMDQDEFIPEVDGWIGAASFLPTAQKSDVTLFV